MSYLVVIDIDGEMSSYVVTDHDGKFVNKQTGLWGDREGRVAENVARSIAGQDATVEVYRRTKHGRAKVR